MPTVHPPPWGQAAGSCLEEWKLSMRALLRELWKVQEGDIGALKLEYLPCGSTASSFSYKEALVLSEIMQLSQVLNETGFHCLFVITSSSTAAILDAWKCTFSDDLLAGLPASCAVICALVLVAAAICQLEVVAASPSRAIFPQTRTWRQLISRHSQNQTQQSWVIFGLVVEADSKPSMILWSVAWH